MHNAFTVDVEDYYHATNMDAVVGPARWHEMPSRVVYSTSKLLDTLDKYDVKGTFFILGYVARRQPGLVKKIAAAGHEVASHGYGHRLAYLQTPEEFSRDVNRAKCLLEDISGQTVRGYRAPNFSILPKNAWAYDKLLEAGYQYDSSVYPVKHPRYGNTGQSREPFTIKRESGILRVFPLATAKVSLLGQDIHLPIAGGAYWRLLPKSYLSWGLRRVNEKESMFCNCYIHPWELDAEQPVFSELPALTRLRHYGGIKKFEEKLCYFLEQFEFCPLSEFIAE